MMPYEVLDACYSQILLYEVRWHAMLGRDSLHRWYHIYCISQAAAPLIKLKQLELLEKNDIDVTSWTDLDTK